MTIEPAPVLDTFCGAGGVARGLADAGLSPYGVDIKPQPSYPYPFHLGPAVDVLGDDGVTILERGVIGRLTDDEAVPFTHKDGRVQHMRLGDFFAGHGSPPCQGYGDLQKQSKIKYPKLIEPTRAGLRATGLPFVIENVEGAPLIDPILLCGTQFAGLRVERHRLFEAGNGLRLVGLPHATRPRHPYVHTFDKRKSHFGHTDEWLDYVQVTGGGNCTVAAACDAMGIERDWMGKEEINEAIPPAFMRFVGMQLYAHIAAGINHKLRNLTRRTVA